MLTLNTERSNVKFHANFQTWNYLEKYLIYLPVIDTYLDPINNAYRIGCYNPELSAIDGLFVKRVKLGNFESAIAEIKPIVPTEFNENYYHMDINIHLDVDNLEANINTIGGFKGLSGGYFNHFYNMGDKDQKEALLKQITGQDEANTIFNKLEVIDHTEIAYLKNAEFIYHSNITTPNIIEYAGNKILLNIGQTIGQQTEMYFKDERESLLENEFNRSYYREITVQIPDGYRVVNPESVNLTFAVESEGKNIHLFNSKHLYEGQVFKVTLDEFYKEIYVSEEQFEGFKAVVNAVADFNKVVLVLEAI